MENFLKEKIFDIKIRNKSACFFIQIKEEEPENKILDSLAAKISTENAILIIDGCKISDNKFVKLTEKIQYLCSEFETTLLIYNRADIAFITNADGIFLDENGIPAKQAKTILPDNSIIIEKKENFINITELQ